MDEDGGYESSPAEMSAGSDEASSTSTVSMNDEDSEHSSALPMPATRASTPVTLSVTPAVNRDRSIDRSDPPAMTTPDRVVVAETEDLAAAASNAEEDAPLTERIVDRGVDLLTRGADMVASFSPFKRATLEATIDNFLDSLQDVESESSSQNVPIISVHGVLAVGVGLTLAEVVRRKLRRKDEALSYTGLSGLPRHWAMEE